MSSDHWRLLLRHPLGNFRGCKRAASGERAAKARRRRRRRRRKRRRNRRRSKRAASGERAASERRAPNIPSPNNLVRFARTFLLCSSTHGLFCVTRFHGFPSCLVFPLSPPLSALPRAFSKDLLLQVHLRECIVLSAWYHHCTVCFLLWCCVLFGRSLLGGHRVALLFKTSF